MMVVIEVNEFFFPVLAFEPIIVIINININIIIKTEMTSHLNRMNRNNENIDDCCFQKKNAKIKVENFLESLFIAFIFFFFFRYR